MKCDLKITNVLLTLLVLFSLAYGYASLIGMKTAVESLKECLMMLFGAVIGVWTQTHATGQTADKKEDFSYMDEPTHPAREESNND